MMIEFIESKATKIGLSIFGILLLPLILAAAIHGLIFFIPLFTEFSFISLGIALSSLFGLIGFISAWHRLFLKHLSMSNYQITYIRSCFFLGIASCLIILIGLIHFKLGASAITACVLAMLCGILFVQATPKKHLTSRGSNTPAA